MIPLLNRDDIDEYLIVLQRLKAYKILSSYGYNLPITSSERKKLSYNELFIAILKMFFQKVEYMEDYHGITVYIRDPKLSKLNLEDILQDVFSKDLSLALVGDESGDYIWDNDVFVIKLDSARNLGEWVEGLVPRLHAKKGEENGNPDYSY